MLRNYLLKIMQLFFPVHIARTMEEKNAIFRYRYKIYVEKMKIKFMD